jgi:hypothetical protein
MTDTRLNGEELNRRLNTIAINAIREGQIAKGRGHLPFIDDDWRRANMISQILDLVDLEMIDNSHEHFPLSLPMQAPKNPRLDGIEGKLADALLNLPIEEEPVAKQSIKKAA